MANPTLSEQFAEILGQIQQNGLFYTTGTIEVHTPRLEVDGVGLIALPLLPIQAKQLIAIAEQAPYGRGTETLIDTKVRCTWQISAKQVNITGKGWQNDLNIMIQQAAIGLGIAESVEAELYKILIYEKESFFIEHRDSEKTQGMFATMVVVLPSDYHGGELVLHHQGKKTTLNLHRHEPAEVAFAAFYADCVHEVRPITSGYRLTLIYNLKRQNKNKDNYKILPTPYHADVQKELTTFLNAWAHGNDEPNKLIYPLEHAYTEAQISFNALKGRDASKGAVTAAAAAASNCEALVALLRIQKSGSAEYTGYKEQNQEDFEIIEVYNSSQTLSHWQRPNGTSPELGELPFAKIEISPPTALDAITTDNIEFSEATGNEGASFDRIYSRAALVVWPHNRRLAVIAMSGITPSIAILGDLIAEWRSAGAQPQVPQYTQAIQFATAIRREWPSQPLEQYKHRQAGETAVFLGQLLALNDNAGLEAFLSAQTANGNYGIEDNNTLLKCLAYLPAPRAYELLQAIVAKNTYTQAAACANLLYILAKSKVCTQFLPLIAKTLVNANPNKINHTITSNTTDQRIKFIQYLLPALEHIDNDLAAQTVEKILDPINGFTADTHILPAVIYWHKDTALKKLPNICRTRNAMLAHLQTRVAKPLGLPADWQPVPTLNCKCPVCTDLTAFLTDATTQTWRYKASQEKRTHVQSVIEDNGCDLDCTTDKRGRPYTLICTKNQASYKKSLQQREADLQLIATLTKM